MNRDIYERKSLYHQMLLIALTHLYLMNPWLKKIFNLKTSMILHSIFILKKVGLSMHENNMLTQSISKIKQENQASIQQISNQGTTASTSALHVFLVNIVPLPNVLNQKTSGPRKKLKSIIAASTSEKQRLIQEKQCHLEKNKTKGTKKLLSLGLLVTRRLQRKLLTKRKKLNDQSNLVVHRRSLMLI